MHKVIQVREGSVGDYDAQLLCEALDDGYRIVNATATQEHVIYVLSNKHA